MKGWARFVGRAKNMVLVIHRSWKNNRTGFGTFRLVCELYGERRKRADTDMDFPPASTRVLTSRRCGCEFELEGHQHDDDNWTMRVICGSHNHDLPETLLGHAYAGRITPTQQKMVYRDATIGTRPRNVLRGLKIDDSECVTDIRQVYNAMSNMKRDETEGRRDLPQALHSLDQKGYYVVSRKSPQLEGNEVSDIILAHPDSRHLLRLFPYVIVMDTTYKTNQ